MRLPGLALVVYLLRDPIVTVIETRFDILGITTFVIEVLSTPVARLAGAAAFFSACLLVIAMAKRFPSMTAYLVVLLGAGVIVSIASMSGSLSQRRAMLVWLIIALHLAPSGLPALVKGFSRAWNMFMIAGVGAAELLFAREYYVWLRSRVPFAPRTPAAANPMIAAAIPGALIASLVFAVLVRGESLLAFEQRIRLSGDARVIARGESFNWLELDRSGRYFYVTGHTLPYLQRYDLQNLTAPPLQSRVSTGGAQGFAYDPAAAEIYTVNTSTNQVQFFDAATLEAKRAIDVRELSPGDPWVAVDAGTDTVTIVSEADVRVGAPLVVLNRTTGLVVGEAPLDAGNVLKHPSQPWLYLSFFRRRNEVLLYDLTTRSITHKAPADPRAERMVYWKRGNELLVTSPLESRIMRFDADGLESKGYIRTSFGVRAIAVDEARQLLLCGNLATGYLEIVALPAGTVLRKHYLGPWLRTIQLQVESGTAYVSSNGALYTLNYASPLRHTVESSRPEAPGVAGHAIAPPRVALLEPRG